MKNVVFDLGGVLVDFDPERMINDNFPPEYHDIIYKNVFRSVHWLNMDKGTETVEEALDNMLPNIPEDARDKMREVVLDRESQMPPLTEMTPIINTLHEGGYRLFVLSNCAKWLHEFKNTIPSNEYFEGFFVSADYNVVKPDRIIYEMFLEKFNLKAEECLFIDDSPANTEAAEKLGFKVFCFKDKDFEGLKQYISQLTKE